jgi:hypothetical protein
LRKNNKKPAISDGSTRVLIETIAAYTVDNKSIKVYLRSGERLNLSWDSAIRCRAVRDVLDDYFNMEGGNNV